MESSSLPRTVSISQALWLELSLRFAMFLWLGKPGGFAAESSDVAWPRGGSFGGVLIWSLMATSQAFLKVIGDISPDFG